jgi:hypothetical protein
MKATITLITGLRWPGVVASDESTTLVEKVNPTTNVKVTFPVTRVDIMTLRETREGEKYLALTNEVVQYGYRPIMEEREGNIVGLDIDENKKRLTLQALRDLHGVSYSAWQAAGYAARNDIVGADEV